MNRLSAVLQFLQQRMVVVRQLIVLACAKAQPATLPVISRIVLPVLNRIKPALMAAEHIPPAAKQILPWLLCALLVVSAAGLWQQGQGVSEQLARQRLRESALNDLTVQSHAMAYVHQGPNPWSRLNLFGYQSNMELLNQLDNRLKLLETLNAQTPTQSVLISMRQTLEALIELHRSTKPEESKPLGHNALIESWFQQLQGLSNIHRQAAMDSDRSIQKIANLNRKLCWALIALSLIWIGYRLWMNSKTRAQWHASRDLAQQLARQDALTGLLNLQGWEELANAHIDAAVTQETRKPGSLVLFNVDYLKQFNETFGHAAGEQRLKMFADHLRENFRPSDLIARVGPEEFAVLLPNCLPEEAFKIVERLRTKEHPTRTAQNRTANPENASDLGFTAGISGILLQHRIGRTMAMADQALYQAKTKGRNRTAIA